MKVLEVEGCCSSVVRALVAEANGPRFDSLRRPRFFHFFPLLFSRPLYVRKFLSNLHLPLLILGNICFIISLDIVKVRQV